MSLVNLLLQHTHGSTHFSHVVYKAPRKHSLHTTFCRYIVVQTVLYLVPPFSVHQSFAADRLGREHHPIKPEYPTSPKGPDRIPELLIVDRNPSRTRVSITRPKVS